MTDAKSDAKSVGEDLNGVTAMDNTQPVDLSGNVNTNADETFLITPEEEEKDDISQVLGFGNSELMLSLEIGDGKEDAESIEEEETNADSLGPESGDPFFSMPPSVQEEENLKVKQDDDAPQTEPPVSTEQMLTKTDLLEKADGFQLEESIEIYGTPPTDGIIPSLPLIQIEGGEGALQVDDVHKTPAKIEEVERPMWMQEKEKCLNATIDERRKKPKCTELSSIKTWPEYYNTNINKGPESAEAESSEISKKVSIWQGDITSLLIDAIVNAANEKLLGGGGVDYAIHTGAGPLLLEECYGFGGRVAGQSVITGGYNLPARYVIHSVGPRGEQPDKLRDCYLSSLQLLIDENQRTIAFPCISTGIFGYPNDKAAEVVLKTVREWLEENHQKVDRVIFCLFMDKDVKSYREKMQQYFPMMGGQTEDPLSPEQGVNGSPLDVTSPHPDESEHPDPPISDPIPPERIRNHSIEHGDAENIALISTAQNGTHWRSWRIWKILIPCCDKPKTS